MYTTPATTVGLASRAGAGLPLITGGCQCHTCVTEPEFDVVNAVALLTELCCGPCSYWGQSRFGARAPAAPAAGASTTPARPSAAISGTAGHRWLIRNIVIPSSIQLIRRASPHENLRSPGRQPTQDRHQGQ